MVLFSIPLNYFPYLPTSMDSIEKLKEDILQTYKEEILGIHEFHLWSLMHGQIVANLHVTFRNTEVCIIELPNLNS